MHIFLLISQLFPLKYVDNSNDYLKEIFEHEVGTKSFIGDHQEKHPNRNPNPPTWIRPCCISVSYILCNRYIIIQGVLFDFYPFQKT